MRWYHKMDRDIQVARDIKIVRAYEKREEVSVLFSECVLLDTLPFLQSAIHMYKKYGFYETERYNDSPMDTSIYMKLDL